MKFFFNKYFLSLLILIVFFSLFLFYLLAKIDRSENLLNRLENSLNTTKYLFEEQKRYALSLAILLSKDEQIIQSFLAQNREKSFELINQKINTLKEAQEIEFDVQLHNLNLTTYLRSWDLSKKDIELDSFRQGLVSVKKNLKPFVSIELGERLNIKAISPIVMQESYLGSLEVIIGFENLAKELKKRGCELLVLLENKHLSIARQLQHNPKIDNFTLVNENLINILDGIELSKLQTYGYISNKKYGISYFSYYDLEENFLGYILIAVENKEGVNINKAYEPVKIIENKENKLL